MEEITILEILDHFGRVRERYPLKEFPAVIGRAYDNAVILDDAYVCPHHLEISRQQDGQLMLRDMNTVNGSHYLSDRQSFEYTPLQYDRKLKIGHTHIRFRGADHAVKATRVDRIKANILGEMLTSRITPLLSLLCLVAFLYFNNYMSSYNEFKAGKHFFSDILPVLIMILVWSGIWSIISKVSTHYFFYTTHLAIAVLGTLLAMLFSIADSYSKFAFSLQPVIDIPHYLTTLMVMSLMLYGHLRFCTQIKPRKLTSIATSVSLLIVSLLFIGEYIDKKDEGAYSKLNTTIKPPAFQFKPSIQLEEMFNRTDLLKIRIDSEIKESAK